MQFIDTIVEHPAFETGRRVVQFGPRQRKRALTKLSNYVDNSISLAEGLSQMINFATRNGQNPNAYSATVFSRWRDVIQSGGTLPEALKGYIPESERSMIAAADRFENLGQGIRDALTLRERIAEIRKAIRGAVLYPLALVGGLTGFFIFMSLNVFPGYHDALPDVSKWPTSASRLELTSNFVYNHVLALYLVLVAAVVVFTISLPRWTGPLRAKLDGYAPYGIYKIVYGTVFLLGLSGYLKAGMNLPEVLTTTIAEANPWYGEKLSPIHRHVKSGQNLGDAMSLSVYEFPNREIIEDLRCYSQYSALSQVLEDMGNEILVDSITKIKVQAAWIRNFAVFALGSLMFWFMSSMFDFQNAVAAMAQSPN